MQGWPPLEFHDSFWRTHQTRASLISRRHSAIPSPICRRPSPSVRRSVPSSPSPRPLYSSLCLPVPVPASRRVGTMKLCSLH
eukprot:574963-Rhodomonas_salina.2